MQVSLTPGEWWILNSAALIKFPLTFIVDPELWVHYNRRMHGLEPSIILDALEGLFAEGLLEAEQWTSQDVEIHLGSLSRDEIRQALDPETKGELWRAQYCLTAKGGAAWEAFARPYWEQFLLEEGRVEEDSMIWNVTAADRKWLEYYRSLLSTDNKNEVPATSSIVEIGPWSPTYWKSLPRGFRIHYRETDETEPYAYSVEEANKKQLLFSGLCSMRDSWCPGAR